MKKPLVIGLGQTGLSILAFLQKRAISAIGFDTRADLPNLAETQAHFDCACYLEHLPDAIWPFVSQLIVSPGVDLQHPVILKARALNLSIIGDIELFYREARAPIIAITGTNAKSTVTSLLFEMIQACGKNSLMGGNIGIPALALLDHPQPDYYILELSSFQLDLLQDFKADVGCVLNISPDHLDRHGTMIAYQKSKERIYAHCHFPIFNREMPYFTAQKAAFSFALSEPKAGNEWGILAGALALGSQKIMPIDALSQGLSGRHNLENALSALAITAPLNLPLPAQIEVLKHFKGLPHRCTFVKTINDVSWYNDSKGTNVGATLAAIKGMASKTAGKLILLLGGIAKDQDFTPLRTSLMQHVRQVIVYGKDRQPILADLNGIPCIEMETDFPAILKKAKSLAFPGDCILFSPACASQDMFRDYADRGDQFTHWVNKIE
ncbi:MAG: UDP-N-acetylmuramoyl-L-alanine--D-glutamate ligase [Gammaproteobacteria bacterium]|nr:UDP-N-acetylmuramoyl-L-alanine--D-glutamate ligase [Gammaproteobacteria bacterium]